MTARSSGRTAGDGRGAWPPPGRYPAFDRVEPYAGDLVVEHFGPADAPAVDEGSDGTVAAPPAPERAPERAPARRRVTGNRNRFEAPPGTAFVPSLPEADPDPAVAFDPFDDGSAPAAGGVDRPARTGGSDRADEPDPAERTDGRPGERPGERRHLSVVPDPGAPVPRPPLGVAAVAGALFVPLAFTGELLLAAAGRPGAGYGTPLATAAAAVVMVAGAALAVAVAGLTRDPGGGYDRRGTFPAARATGTLAAGCLVLLGALVLAAGSGAVPPAVVLAAAVGLDQAVFLLLVVTAALVTVTVRAPLAERVTGVVCGACFGIAAVVPLVAGLAAGDLVAAYETGLVGGAVGAVAFGVWNLVADRRPVTR